MPATRSLVGRDAELEQLTLAIEDACQGRGAVWFVSGEPGIGKTRLVEEAARRCVARDVSVCWGRCWEAGGAPAYWPWIEVLRGLLRAPEGSPERSAVMRRAGVLSQLLPELDAREPGGALAQALGHVGGERGRFELFDAITQALCDAARDAPRLVVIEDLHVADEATIGVLELLTQQARSSRLLLLGTLRDAEARLGRASGVLARLARGPRSVELMPLRKAEVASFLSESHAAPPSDAACEAVFRVTEGNPLFLVEVARLLSERHWPAGDSVEVAIPRSVRQAIRVRLERLSPRARAALEIASVIGRQFRAATLSELAERPLAELAAPLTEALDEGVLTEFAPAEYRFSHVLLREVLHRDLPEERRAGLHWEAADALRRRGAQEAPWSEIAHHLLEAGPSARDAAVEACQSAAAASLRQLAFADAVEWYTRGLAALGQDPSADLGRRGTLLLALAEAQFHAGEIDGGHASCRRALGLGKQLGDGELFARGALAYGTVLKYAVVDPTLVALLREALDLLPEGPGKTRSVVMARLAAAEQPAPEPERSFELAREAIAMARREHDPDTLLATLRYAISALMDLGAPSERLELNREYVRLAEARGEPIEALRGSLRQAFDHLELGDLAAMEACIELIETRTRRFAHPFYAWRAHAFRALLAVFHGQADAALGHVARAEELGAAGRDPSAATCAAFQRHMLLRSLGRDAEVVSVMPRLSQLLGGSELCGLALRTATAEALLRVGRKEQAAAHLQPGDLEKLIHYGDASTFAPLANVALAFELRALADPALAVLEARPRVFASGGMATMCAGEPIAHIRATLHRLAGRHERAAECYEQALEQARQAGAIPFAIAVALDHATLLDERAGGGDAGGRARELAAEALELGEQIGATMLVEPAARDGRSQEALPRASGQGVSIERDGESWLIRCGHVRVRLADSKGLHWLARLVGEPGREFHVLDLAVAEGAIDAGDAGELLDGRARDEYQARLETLDGELAEARAHNDAGRATRLAAEREFLETELARALGLGGRQRRAGGAAERARINVQRRLRDAIRRITLQHAELGQRLERSLKTGVYCSYRP